MTLYSELLLTMLVKKIRVAFLFQYLQAVPS